MGDFTADSTLAPTDTQDPDGTLSDLMKQLVGGGVMPSAAGPPPFTSAGPSIAGTRNTSQNVPMPPTGAGAATAMPGSSVAASQATPTIDWSKLGDMTLQSKLQELDARFPPGLRHDRPYTVDETNYHDDTRQLSGEYGGVKNRRPMMRNPITGGAVPASPYITPQMLTAAANTLVEAKARARAEIINGAKVNDAAVEALSHAFGVDPATMKGLPLDLAGRMLPHVAQLNREKADTTQRANDQKAARAEQQTAMERIDPAAATATTGIERPEIADQVFREAVTQGKMKAAADLSAQRAQTAEENKNKIGGAMTDLMNMDPEEAARQAPQRLAQFMDQRGENYAKIVGQFQTHAQQASVARASQQKAEAANAQKETQRAQRQYDVRGKPLEESIGVEPASAKKPRPAGLAAEAGGPDQYEFNFHQAVAKQLSKLSVYAANEREDDPQFDDKFAQAVEMAKSRMPGGAVPPWASDPKHILDSTDPLDDPRAELSHVFLRNVAMALRALRGQRPQ